ncbi:type II secretion system protein N [Colwellia psychrerythraea]|uniref:Type II secretion system protein N n=1 Tax=Colwellia psychrerythraea TaxID=28229 RepID=A0A099KU67_COLPS|nr:type II secretion system protein N [Colwellia psychrerythraea]KGJ94319.1 Type II secretion system, protein N [Colwellia psychrerythraea]
MKKWFAFTAIFLSSYMVFLLASTPLALVINNVKLPKNIVLQGISGSIWHGEITKVIINNNEIEQVKTAVSFWSLFSLPPNVQVTFGDAMSSGPEGQLSLTLSSEQLTLTDVEIFMSANDIAKQLPLPIPLSAQGNVELFLSELVITTGAQLSCSKAEGELLWSRAGVVALEQNIKLGKFTTEISCNQGKLLAKVSPKNNLGLSFDGVLTLATQKVSGNGYLKPGAKFPPQLRSTLSFIGRPDNQGRYQLRF